MPSNSPGQRITVYFGERDTWQHHSLAMTFLEMLRREGCSGATVTRGVAGFGAGSRIKTATLAELSGDLPLVLTVVDTPAPRVNGVSSQVASARPPNCWAKATA